LNHQRAMKFELDGLVDRANPPFQGHSPTSRAAAKEIAGPARSLKSRVHEFIARRGDSGCTDEEIQIALEMNPSTQRPRRVDLVRDGVVEDSGRQRKTRSGRNATIWVIKKT